MCEGHDHICHKVNVHSFLKERRSQSFRLAQFTQWGGAIKKVLIFMISHKLLVKEHLRLTDLPKFTIFCKIFKEIKF